MKKFSTAKILSLIIVCVMLLGALALTAFATEDENLDIVFANVNYGDTYQIMFAVDAPEGATVKATDSEGNEINVVPFEADEIPYQAYILTEGIAAQAIDEVITLSVEYNGKTVSKNYSVLRYVYQRTEVLMNKTDATEKELAELDMLNALLAYAVKADAFFNGVTENSFDKYQFVSATGVTVNGIAPTGMYAPGVAPFASIDAIEYDAEKYDLVITVNGETKTLDELKALVVGDTKIDVVVEIVEKAHEHSYTSVVTDPTCIAAGYTTYTCECGHSYTEAGEAATGEHVDNDGDYKCDFDGCTELVLPEADSVLTIEQALKIGALYAHDTYTTNKYYVTGIITDVYNTKYGNMHITDGTNSFTIYGVYMNGVRYDAMETKPQPYDEITVYGAIGQYNGTPQIKNAEIDDLVAHVHSYSEATCKAPETCTVCGATNGEKLEHNYVDGVCDRCGAEQPTSGGEVTEVTVTTKISDYAANNGWSDATQYGTMNIDENITVTAIGGGNTGKYYTNGNNWRIYQNENPAVTITAAEGKTILSVKITYTISKTGVLTLNGSNVASDTVVNVNDSSITFSVGNTGSATNGQVRITAIEVIYA